MTSTEALILHLARAILHAAYTVTNQQRCGHKSQFHWLLSVGTCIFNLDHTGHKLTRKNQEKEIATSNRGLFKDK